NRMLVEKYAFTEPERYWHYLHHLFPKNNFLVCALDMAYWDLYAKSKRQPLYKFFTDSLDRAPLTDYTIGIADVRSMISKADSKPWPIYKVKLGTPDDLDVVTELRKHTEGLIRVDANAGWTAQQAIELVPKLRSLGIEFIEQPLAVDDKEGMKLLFDASQSIYIADESCVQEKDVESCVGLFNGINIKLTKCGGITPALRMIKKARELGLKVMIGSMNESTVGSAAIVHLSGLVDYMDCDGPLLLSEDIASGLIYDNGRVQVNNEPGLGVRLFDDIANV
ncbi:MAG TPA: dipeptide epimerase, partial [Flavitalea sp.]|nr:dipeptide epimerase [Flavitalea sp.]